MTPPSAPAARYRRWLLWGSLGLCAVVAMLVPVAHVRPVRDAVLARAVAVVRDRSGIVLTAASLDYNLLALSFSLSEIEASKAGGAVPFFVAARVEVNVPWSALWGTPRLDRVAVTGGRIDVQVAADGTTNLPSSSGGDGEPAPLPIGRLLASPLAVSYVDASLDLTVALPALFVDVGADRGEVRQRDPGFVRWRAARTTVHALEGGVTFDGRSVRLAGISLDTDDIDVAVTGSLTVLAARPSLDGQLTASGDVGRLARWATDADVPAGTLAIEGTVSGPLAAPTATLRAVTPRLTWRGLEVTSVETVVVLDPTALRVNRADARAAGGRVQLTGGLEFDGTDATMDASWTALDLERLCSVASPGATLCPSGRTTGTIAARGRGDGLAAWTADVRSRVEGGRTAPGRLSLAGAVRGGLGDSTWHLAADLRVGGVPLVARVGGLVRVDDPDASTVTGEVTSATTLGEVARLAADLRVANTSPDLLDGTAQMVTMLSGTFGAPRFEATASLANVAGAGLSNMSIDAAARGSRAGVDVSAELRHADGNRLTAKGQIAPSGSRFDATIEGRLGDIGGLLPEWPVDGAIDLQLSAGGPFGAPRLVGSLRASDLRYASFAVGPATATVDADTREVHIDSTFEALEVRAEVSATLTGTRAARLELRADQTDLSRLMPADATVPLTGVMSLSASADAPLDDWRAGRARLDVSRLDARLGDWPLSLSAPARVAYADDTIDVQGLEARGGGLSLSAAGRLPVGALTTLADAADALQAVVTGDAADVIAAVDAVGLSESIGVRASGPVLLVTRVDGSLERAAITADIEVGPGTAETDGVPGVSPLQVRARVREGWLDLLQASGTWQGADVRGTGRVPLRLLESYLPPALASALGRSDGDAELSLSADAITPRVLEPFLTPDAVAQLDGSLTLSAELRAAALEIGALRGAVQIDRLDLRLAGLPVTQQSPTRVVIGGGTARVAAWDWQGPDSDFRVRGQVELATTRADLQTDGRVDLRLLTPFLSPGSLVPGGIAEPHIRLTGPLDGLRVTGELRVDGGSLRLDEPRIAATDLTASMQFDGTTVRLERLEGQVNGGTVTAAGRLDAGPGATQPGSISATLQGVALEFPAGLRSTADAELTLVLTPGAAPARARLGGTVTITRSAYREPFGVVTALFRGLRTSQLAAASLDPDAFASRLELDVRLLTDDDLVVDNNLADAEIGADLRIIGTAAAPALSGRSTIREGGQLRLGGNTYTVETGTIDFSNPSVIEPDLTVVANTSVARETIELTLTGTPETLDVSLRSPSAPELGQADLASMLLTGRPLDEALARTDARQLGEQVLGYLSGDVLGVAGRAIGLDTIRLGGMDPALSRDPSAVATGADPTSRLTFTKSVGTSLDLTLSQSLRDPNAQTWIVDHVPVRGIDLRLVSGDDTLRWYELRHDVQLGVRRQPRQAPPRLERERPVVSVSLSGDLPVPVAQLLDGLALREGGQFDAAAWQDDRDRIEARLQRTGRLGARVSARMAEYDGGVALAYVATPGPPTRVAIDGYTPAGSVRDAIETAWARAVSDTFLTVEAADIVQRAAVQDGYVEARATAGMEPGDQETVLRVSVAPGTRTRSREVQLARTTAELEAFVAPMLRQRTVAALAWADPSRLERTVRDALVDRGYLRARARVSGPVVEQDVARWTVALDEGPVFSVGTVTVVGDAPRAGDLLAPSDGLVPAGPYVPASVEAARQRLVDAYRRLGFAQARVSVQPEPDDAAGVVALTIAVTPGPQQVLRTVTIRGTRTIAARAVEEALGLTVGAPLSADAWIEARARVFDTGLFRRADVSAEPVEPVAEDASEQPVEVVVTVEEWPALRLRYGLQLAEEFPEDRAGGRTVSPGLSADVMRRTLFGHAVTVGAAGVWQRRDRLGRAFASRSRLFGLPITTLVVAQRSREELSTSDPLADVSSVTVIDRTSVTLEQQFRLARRLRLAYSYAFEANHTFEREPLDPAFPISFRANVARLSGNVAFDTRDSPLDSTRGWLVSSGFEWGLPGSASDLHFVRYTGQAYYFRPWRGVVLASAARLGLARPFDGQILIPSERFYAGGARSVRGVEEGALGPRSFGLADGGAGSLVLNQEVRVPLYKWLRGVLFADAGDVFERAGSIRVGDLPASVGAGLRLATPFGLLRVDYGRLVSARPDVTPVRWTFGIGQAF